MPEEEIRLLAEVVDSAQLSNTASATLRRPGYSVVSGSDVHRKLLEADRAARARYEAAIVALRLYRQAEQPHGAGAGG
jgi:hypothetical protein